MTDTEKRLLNIELALIGLFSAINDTLPPAYAETVEKIAQDFFNASESIGGFSEPVFQRSYGNDTGR